MNDKDKNGNSQECRKKCLKMLVQPVLIATQGITTRNESKNGKFIKIVYLQHFDSHVLKMTVICLFTNLTKFNQISEDFLHIAESS